MLVLLGALGGEIAGLRRQMVIEEASTERDYRIYKGKYGSKNILLGQTGLGKENAERATKFILERHPAEALICLGFAGALIEGLKVGDIILSTTLYSGDDQTQEGLRLRSPSYSDANLVSIATENQKVKMARFFKGSSVTVANPVSEPKAKLALGKAFRAEVVDMESYWIARIASVNRIPFLSIRAVSDTVKDTLPPFDQFLNSGQWQWRSTILYFLTHPQQLVKLFCLYRNVRRASRNLAAFMDSFITRAVN
jgi:adenosylhomocysteine nucleosidase